MAVTKWQSRPYCHLINGRGGKIFLAKLLFKTNHLMENGSQLMKYFAAIDSTFMRGVGGGGSASLKWHNLNLPVKV